MGSKDISPAPAAALIQVIELCAPHTHAGREYPAGARLDLALQELDVDSARWLVGLGKAVVVEPKAAKPAGEE